MAQSDDCGSLSLEISNGENVIRGIYYEVHLNDDGTLKWQAYDPTPGTDEVSVMRSAHLSPSACKKKAKSIERAPRKLYRGLATLVTGAIRGQGMAVTDSRTEYCGHAHISLGIVTKKRQPHVPRDIREVEQVKAAATKLIRLSRYHADANIRSLDWEGEPLLHPDTPQK